VPSLLRASVPRKNKRDPKLAPRETKNGELAETQVYKPVRRRKGKGDKKIYKENYE
jgi:hypothetical protein